MAMHGPGGETLVPAATSPSIWRDGWRAWRDRLLASPRFQRWAASFPLTRPIARRRARAVFDLCAGFVYSQILLACVRLGVLRLLAAGPLPLSAIAARLVLPEEAAQRLLDSAASLRLLERRGPGVYGLGPLGAAALANPGIGAMVEHHTLFYEDLRDPVALLRGQRHDTRLGRYWSYAVARAPAELEAGQVAGYSALMAASQSLVAAEVLDAYPFASHRCLLDVGGGEGGFLAEAGSRCKGLRLMLFDLPAVVDRARRRLSEAGLSDRSSVHGGDFHRTALPRGADLISFVRVLHDHDDPAALALLRAAHAALPPGGRVLIAEPMAATPGAEAMGDAYFGWYLMAMRSGRPRSAAEITALLAQAGFTSVRISHTRQPLLVSVLSATRPS
jgi:demethylspheroidene O-methyltransferase